MKKSVAEDHRMLSNTYGEAAISERTCREWFQRFKNGDFEVEDQHGGGREKVFEDAELEALLDQDLCPTQQELSGSLGVTQQATSKRLEVMGMIQKLGNWVPYELKPRDVERLCLLVNSCLQGKDRRDFCIALRLRTKNGFATIIPSAENHGDIPIMLPRRRPNLIFTVPRSCSVFGGISSA
ncbi:mariner Mos1 transposase [Trichonephila clavipes]|nr:mariner Mos1 transposase [Trichonephila clavipes]